MFVRLDSILLVDMFVFYFYLVILNKSSDS